MKKSNVMIHVPEPCHEDWNKMLPDAKGKFCNSCNKSVFDFTHKTDKEIRDILVEYKDQKVCGHFKKSQLDRPLNISINLRDLPKNISLTKTFAIALFIVFGTFLFSCTNEQGQKVETIEIVKSPDEIRTLGGIDFMIPEVHSDTTMSFVKGNAIEETQVAEIGCAQGATIGFASIEPVFDSIVTLDEIPVIVNAEPLTDYAVLGGIGYRYVETNDIDDSDSTWLIPGEKLSATNMNKPAAFTIYPNPSNGEFTVMYDVAKKSDVSLVVYDMKGILIKSLVNIHDQYEGKYQIPVNLNDLPNGIYIVSLIIGDKKYTERVVIEK